jgi:hypothetical protein
MPSFNCDPNADTAGLVDLSDGWRNCTSIVTFPSKDFSSGVKFYRTWDGCTVMESIAQLDLYSKLANAPAFVSTWEGCNALFSFQPNLNLGSATLFDRTWKNCSSLTSFPFTGVDSGTAFTNTWEGCTSLETFPPNMFNACSASNYAGAWFGCALSPQSIENILVSVDASEVAGGTLNVDGGNNACYENWTAPAFEAFVSLTVKKGWTIFFNDCLPG